MSRVTRWTGFLAVLGTLSLVGCAHRLGHGRGMCRSECRQCGANGEGEICEDNACGNCGRCGCRGRLADLEWKLCGWMWTKSNSIPDTLPLGSTVRAHDQVMQTNAEAADFLIYRHEFVGQTAELTSDGKDHILEIAAHMKSTPFPVIVEREENNSDPELDAHRRNLVAQIVTDLGNPDGQQRTVVATAYGPGYLGTRGERMYYQHIYGQSGTNNFGGSGYVGGGNGGGGFY